MKVTYFEDTGALYIEFLAEAIVQTRDLDESSFSNSTLKAASAR